jgi:tetratricopeptide (TPR) repeat protein
LTLALCLLISGSALGGFLIVWGRRPVEPHRLREQAAAAVKAQRYAEAEAALARLNPKRSLDWILQSKVDGARGRPAAALADLAHIPDSDRLGALARHSAGYVWLHNLHRAEAALAAFRRALELDPESLPARRELSRLYYIRGMKAEFAAQFRALEARGQLTFDDVYHACVLVRGGAETRQIIQELREFLAADPADCRSRLALAEELRGLNRVLEAEQVLAVLPESDTEAQALRARLALDRGDPKAAQAMLAAGPRDDPDLAMLRGRLALARRDLPEAIREYRLALAAHPDQRDVLLGLGRALRLAGDHRAAEPYLQAAADRDGLALLMHDLVAPGATRDPRLLHKHGAACERLRLDPEARAWYGLALAYDPSAGDSRAALARLAHRAADPDQGPGDPHSPVRDSFTPKGK